MRFILITERLPTKEDANKNNDVIWIRSEHWECLGRWDKVPVDATAWKTPLTSPEERSKLYFVSTVTNS
jgi:hypothetical protein